MSDKLEALSQPAAYEVKGCLCHTIEEAEIYVGQPEALYSQEYVTALLAALEEKDQRIAELQQRLQQPIKLPPLMPENLFGGTPQAHMVANSHNNAITACSMSIRDAGFKSECTVWKEAKGE